MDRPRSIPTGFRWLLAACAAGSLALPLAASAHQEALVQSGNQTYWFSVGYLSPGDTYVPIGTRVTLDFSVWRPDPNRPTDFPAPATQRLAGFEKTLQVEMISGGHRRVTNFVMRPGLDVPLLFFRPTAEGSYAFRFFGTLNFTPVDITFTCNPGGHAAGGTQVTVIPPVVAEGTLVASRGAFVCPFSPIAVEGFPIPAADESGTAAQLANDLQQVKTDFGRIKAALGTQRLIGLGGAALGLAALILSLWAISRSRSRTPYG